LTSCAFFPTSPYTLPLIRHIIREGKGFKLTALLSYPGFGLDGLDGSFADLRDCIGLNVHSDIREECCKWERLIVANHHDYLNSESNNRYVISLIMTAFKLKKDVVCVQRLNLDDYESCLCVAKANNCRLIYLPDLSVFTATKPINRLEKLHAFYILFGGIIPDASSMDAFFCCAEALSRKHRVSLISSEENTKLCKVNSIHSIIRSSISEENKIYEINYKLSCVEQREHPEIVLVYSEEPVVAFNDESFNGFGIVPFILSKALRTDLFMCSVPVSYYSPSFIGNLSEGILNQNGYSIDGISISNQLVDNSGILDKEHLSVTYVQRQVVDNIKLQYQSYSSIPAYNLIDDSEKERMAFDIEQAYLESIRTKIIPE